MMDGFTVVCFGLFDEFVSKIVFVKVICVRH
jgi:hypothetical protein